MKTQSISLLLGLTALFATGCVAEGSAQPANTQQAALIRSTCVNIMRVGRSGVDLAACTESLSDSLAARMQGVRTVQSDRDCSAQGLMPGTAQFSTCVLDRQRKGANVTTRTTLAFNASALTYDPAKDVGASEEYYDASFDTKRRREEYSCAQLGLDPGSSEFGECVNGLAASLFNADNPNP